MSTDTSATPPQSTSPTNVNGSGPSEVSPSKKGLMTSMELLQKLAADFELKKVAAEHNLTLAPKGGNSGHLIATPADSLSVPSRLEEKRKSIISDEHMLKLEDIKKHPGEEMDIPGSPRHDENKSSDASLKNAPDSENKNRSSHALRVDTDSASSSRPIPIGGSVSPSEQHDHSSLATTAPTSLPSLLTTKEEDEDNEVYRPYDDDLPTPLGAHPSAANAASSTPSGKKHVHPHSNNTLPSPHSKSSPRPTQPLPKIPLNSPAQHEKRNSMINFDQLGSLEIIDRAPAVDKRRHTVRSVQRNAHVKYDPIKRVFLGLPKEWENALKKQFGLPPSLVPGEDQGYPARIPSVLVHLKQQLVLNGGLKVEGIFRLAPQVLDSEKVKDVLDNGNFQPCRDVHICANLIKVWFRDMPKPLLAHADSEQILSCSNDAKAGEIMQDFAEPYRSVLLWTLDLCLEVIAESSVNKMTAKNMAIILSPNMYRPPEITASMSAADSLKVMTFIKQYTQFVELAISWRRKNPKENFGPPSASTPSGASSYISSSSSLSTVPSSPASGSQSMGAHKTS